MIGVTGNALALPAFPGAEGAGANALGGRGGDIYHVTTLADNGPGSLRYGISSANGPRTILFNLSGNIVLNSTLTITKPYITIAGQSAPGDGICLQNYSFNIAANDVVVRHVRSRLGTNALQEEDAMWINSGTNIVVDHLSASWSVDETLSASRYVANLTVQNCFITESLWRSIHSKGPHGYGGIISSSENSTYTYHHNLYAHHTSRNPRVGSDSQIGTLRLDFRNNLLYDWGYYAGYSGGTDENTELNYVNNYLVAGPGTTRMYAFNGGGVTTHIYQSGNMIDLNKNGALDASNTGWAMFAGSYTPFGTQFDVPSVPTESADAAGQHVIAMSGAMPWRRDAIDRRVAATFFNQNGQHIDFVNPTSFAGDYVTNTINGTNFIGVNPWPTLASEPVPTDSDNDGIPDYWEVAMDWNLGAANNNHVNADGYTDLEWYLNWLADSHAVCDRNGQASLDLSTFTGGLTNLTFTVADGTNGSVSVESDGRTAHFTAATNYSGLASFTFNATDSASGLGFGPVPVAVLISTTNAALTGPTVTLTSPTNGTQFTDGTEVTLSAEAVDGDGTVTNVQFYAGTAEPLTLISEDSSAPYSATWTAPSSSGTYLLRVVAEDNNGLNSQDEIAVDVVSAVEQVSTAVGNGADIEMVERNDPNAARIDSADLNTRWNGTDRNEVVGLRFDLSGYTLANLDNVTLNLINYRDNSSRTIDIYGVTQGAAGGTGLYTTETWSDTTVAAWGDLPGLLESDGTDTTLSIDTANLTLLVDDFTITSLTEGTVETASSTALTDFVKNYTGGSMITFLITQGGSGSGGQFRFASKEASALTSISGTAGEFAPYLSFKSVEPVAPPTLDYQPSGAGTGLDFSWTGSFKLQYQTNQLSTNWVDYPGGSTSPVSVTVEPSQPAVFFRLTQ